MFPSIPNTLAQFLVLTGLSLFIYCFVSEQNLNEKYIIDKINNDTIFINKKSFLGKSGDSLDSKSNNFREKELYDEIKINYQFDSIFLNKIPITDTLRRARENYDLKISYLNRSRLITDSIARKHLVFLRSFEKQDILEYNSLKNFSKKAKDFLFGKIFGLFIFFTGVVIWQRNESFERILANRINFDKPLLYKNCQSCGRNFNSIVKKSFELDGSINYSFCSKCYNDGKFRETFLTQSILIQRILRARKRFGFLNKFSILKNFIYFFETGFITNEIGKLDRWNKIRYLSRPKEFFTLPFILFLLLIIIILTIRLITISF